MAEALHQLSIWRFRERRFVAVAEFGSGAEVTGEQGNRLERPKIEHGIFQRRAGEDEGDVARGGPWRFAHFGCRDF